jgi:ribosomal protein S18 acetylase RimI-like enzyme
MSEQTSRHPGTPDLSVSRVNALTPAELNDLCDATDAAIEAGGGFGWVKLPARAVLERYWQGVLAMPLRILLVARVDGVICGTAQLMRPPANNEAQSFAIQLTGTFIAPWARGHGLGRRLLDLVEETARKEGFSVINLDVRESMTAAISLYESTGYTRFGEHPFYAHVDGKVLKGFYYTKMIGPQA